MPDVSSAIRNTISISLFNRGLAGKVFEDVRKSGAKIVIKNNAPECVLLSPEEYLKIMDELNDSRLLAIANARMADYDASNLIPGDKVFENLGLSDADLEDYNEVELE